jgi:hypothetical protein
MRTRGAAPPAADPTDPEVPNAKRRRELRRRRSFAMVGTVVAVLVVVVLLLIYQTGRQVTTDVSVGTVAPVEAALPSAQVGQPTVASAPSEQTAVGAAERPSADLPALAKPRLRGANPAGSGADLFRRPGF